MTDRDLSHRKARRLLRVLDGEGRPVANASLRLDQTRHEFLFGCGAFEAVNYANMAEDDPGRPFLRERVDKWLDLFNYGTIPFYWGRFEPVEGQPETENRMRGARFLQDHGVTVKGHPLCWHTVCADWLLSYDDETILQKQLDRITREVSAFRGVVDAWDVINEVVIMPSFDRYDNAVTRICKANGRVGLVKKVFAAARDANPDAQLLINDFDNTTAYEILIDGCLQAGVPITAIGVQSHQHQGYWGAEKVQRILDRFGHFGIPIHFTENTLVSGPLVPREIQDLNDFIYQGDATTPEGEERQARQLEELVRILFADPRVSAYTNWDFTDGAWLNAPSGLLRRDNSPKPSYEALRHLIREEWWTNAQLRTDENGLAAAEGFKGDYTVTDGRRSAPLRLTDGLGELTVRLV